MSTIDDELLKEEEESRREIEYIRKSLPSDVQEAYSDSDLLYVTDAIASYFFTSGILETSDDEVEIDLEVISKYVCKMAADEGQGPYDEKDVFFIVQADLDYQESAD